MPVQALLDAHRSTLITTTLLLVLFSTMVFGALTKPMFDLVQGHDGALLMKHVCSHDDSAILTHLDRACESSRLWA